MFSKSCARLIRSFRRKKYRQPARVKRFLLSCMPTNPCPLLFPDMRGQLPGFSRATATQCVYDSHTMRISSSFAAKFNAVCSSVNVRATSGSVPCEGNHHSHTMRISSFSTAKSCVPYARRVCGKNRVRFRVKKPSCLSCKPTNLRLNPNLLQQTYATKAPMLRQLQQKCLFCVRGKMPRRLVLLLLPGIDIRGKIPTSSRATAKRTECQSLCVSSTNVYAFFATAAGEMWIVSACWVLPRPNPV